MSPSSPPLIPRSFYFCLAVSCPHVEGIPRTGKGRLLDLPESCTLPSMAELDGQAPWATVRAGWNANGLGIAVEVLGKPGRIVHVPDAPEQSDGAQFWIDTRDTREIHRASRYCHRFHAAIVPGSGRSLEVAVKPLRIHRASADAPMADPARLQASAERTRGGYRMELFLPAEALNGFDPETNRRLGFSYRVTDPDRGDQFLTVGRAFPIEEDPSLWASMDLAGGP